MMRVLVSLYRYVTTIQPDGSPTKTREFVREFPALLIPISTTERLSLFGDLGIVEFRLYPLTSVEVKPQDEIEIKGVTYQIVNVTYSNTRYIPISVTLRRGDMN